MHRTHPRSVRRSAWPTVIALIAVGWTAASAPALAGEGGCDHRAIVKPCALAVRLRTCGDRI